MRIPLVVFFVVTSYCYFVCAEEPVPVARPAAHLVSCLDVKNFGAEAEWIGDLNADGRRICCSCKSLWVASDHVPHGDDGHRHRAVADGCPLGG